MLPAPGHSLTFHGVINGVSAYCAMDPFEDKLMLGEQHVALSPHPTSTQGDAAQWPGLKITCTNSSNLQKAHDLQLKVANGHDGDGHGLVCSKCRPKVCQIGYLRAAAVETGAAATSQSWSLRVNFFAAPGMSTTPALRYSFFPRQ